MAQLSQICAGGIVEVLGVMVPVSSQLAILDAIIASLPGPGTVTVHLYANDVTPTPATVLADLTEANFTGYADVDVTPNAAGENPDGWGQVDIPEAHFEATGAAIPNNVFGYYLTDTTNLVLLAAGHFDVPVVFDETGDALNLVSNLQLRSDTQAP